MKYLRISLQRGRFFIGASTLTEKVQRQEKRLLFSRTTFLPKELNRFLKQISKTKEIQDADLEVY